MIKLMTCILSALLLFSGCELLGLSDADQPKQKPNTKKKIAPPPKVDPVTAQKEDYARPEYNTNTRRNPFQTDPEVIQPVVSVQSDDRPKEPLEQFSIGELELVAIISSVAVPKAMFVDPTGFGHVLKEGDKIGRNSGVISDIRDNAVEVREGNDEDGQTRVLNVKLREVELRSSDDSALSEEERESLKRLLDSAEGRAALERAFNDAALGASSVEKKDSKKKDTSGNKPVDNRFKGIRPPSN